MTVENRLIPPDDPEARICEECGEPMDFDGVQWECMYCGHKEDDYDEGY